MIVIPIFVAAITPVIVQFYPPATYMMSALVVALGGAVVSAIAAIRQAQPAEPAQSELGTPTPASAPMPEAKPRGFASRWMLGA
jgi:hypothetical protein